MGRESGMINILSKTIPATTIKNHIIVMKPGILLLVLITTFAGLFIGAKGIPPLSVICFTFLGVGMASGGAASLNNLFDRFIDQRMERTKRRPLPSGSVTPSGVLLLGLSMAILSIIIFVLFVNTLTAFLTFIAIFIYVFPYTLFLKRKTPFATLIGSITGALPPTIGYTAIKPVITTESLLLFFIMYIWQHPHFWSLALKYREDYSRAGIPVMPVSFGIIRTKFMVLVSILILFVVSLLPFILGLSGKFYLTGTIILGVIYILLGIVFLLSKKEYDELMFYYSIVYISLLFMIMILKKEVLW